MNSSENLSIIAVGGGGLAASGGSLLREGVDLTGKESGGNVLIIPTARPTQETHETSVAQSTELFGQTLGLPVEVLHGFNTMPEEPIRDELLEWADLVYISGGDTKKMMEVWNKYGIDTKLRIRALGGLVLTGISAGAIAPFRWGHSDWEHYHTDDDNWEFRRVDGLGLINAAITPHSNTIIKGSRRQDLFGDMFAHSHDTQIGIGVDNSAGIKIHNGNLELRSAVEGAGATLLDKRSGVATDISRMDANQPIALEELGLSVDPLDSY